MNVEEAVDKYVERLCNNPTKEVALRSIRKAQILRFIDIFGSFSIAYRDKLQKYAIYCKAEEQEHWCNYVKELFGEMLQLDDEEWLYQAGVLESTGEVLEIMSGDFNWDELREIVGKQEHTSDSMTWMSQMLLTFAPGGLAFVDEIVKPTGLLKVPGNLRVLYNKAKKEETARKREYASSFLKVISNKNFDNK